MTDPLLDLLAVLVRADRELHGWELMKLSGRSGPTVYQTLDRLRTSNWVTCHWEQLGAHENRPRRRFYALTSEGSRLAKMLLAERCDRSDYDLSGFAPVTPAQDADEK